MLITRLGGIPAKGDLVDSSGSTVAEADKIEAVYVADGAISAGHAVMLDATNLTGRLVVTAGVTNDHAAVGIYAGRGGTGANVTSTSLSGKDAVANDVVYVTVYGKETGILDGGTTGITELEALNIGTTVGELDGEATIAAGVIAPFIALAACNTASTATAVFVRCM